MIPPGCCPVVRRTPTHPGHDALNLTPALTDSFILIIMRHKTIRCLIRQSTNGPRTEGLAFSENNLRIGCAPGSGTRRKSSGRYPAPYRPLNPRNVSNGMSNPSFFQRFSALWTYLIRHITARHTRKLLYVFGIKIVIMAVRSNNAGSADLPP